MFLFSFSFSFLFLKAATNRQPRDKRNYNSRNVQRNKHVHVPVLCVDFRADVCGWPSAYCGHDTKPAARATKRNVQISPQTCFGNRRESVCQTNRLSWNIRLLVHRLSDRPVGFHLALSNVLSSSGKARTLIWIVKTSACMREGTCFCFFLSFIFCFCFNY